MLSQYSLTLAHLLFIITHPYLSESSFHFMSMRLSMLCVSHSYLTPSRVSSFHCSFHHFIVFIIISLFISSYVNALGHLVCFTLLNNPCRVSLFHCSFYYIPMTLAIKCILHSYLIFIGFYYFIAYILGSLIFKRMLDLWVYTYKPWSIIHHSFKWFVSSYDYVVQHLCILYVWQDLHFDLSRHHYSWIVNGRMTYESIRNFVMGTRLQIPWTTLYVFLFI